MGTHFAYGGNGHSLADGTQMFPPPPPSAPRATSPRVRANGLDRSGYMTTALAPSKGRLMRCTVPGSTSNCLAMTRTPGLPGVARAFLMRSSSSGAI